jgi:hypothetical protein
MSPSLVIALAVLVGLSILAWWHNYKSRDGIHPDLLQATKGNKALAKRLLKDVRFRYPGKTERWYVEKVLYDLERDGAGSARRPRASMSRQEARDTFFLIAGFLWIMSMLTNMMDDIFRR